MLKAVFSTSNTFEGSVVIILNFIGRGITAMIDFFLFWFIIIGFIEVYTHTKFEVT